MSWVIERPSPVPTPSGFVGGDGTVNADSVARLIRGQLGGIRSCYERELRQNPALSGRLDGRLFEASAEVVVDALADSTPGSGPRVTRALGQGRVRFFGGRLRAEVLGGMDQSPIPMSLVTRWPSQSG